MWSAWISAIFLCSFQDMQFFQGNHIFMDFELTEFVRSAENIIIQDMLWSYTVGYIQEKDRTNARCVIRHSTRRARSNDIYQQFTMGHSNMLHQVDITVCQNACWCKLKNICAFLLSLKEKTELSDNMIIMASIRL